MVNLSSMFEKKYHTFSRSTTHLFWDASSRGSPIFFTSFSLAACEVCQTPICSCCSLCTDSSHAGIQPHLDDALKLWTCSDTSQCLTRVRLLIHPKQTPTFFSSDKNVWRLSKRAQWRRNWDGTGLCWAACAGKVALAFKDEGSCVCGLFYLLLFVCVCELHLIRFV